MDKQRSLLDGALLVFARDGYSRASIQTLAAEAGVSTRTIYNQYGSKKGLFRAVMIDSATRVADRQVTQLDDIFLNVHDLRSTLVQFGLVWSSHDAATSSHFALVRQVGADEDHIDPDVLQAWRQAGPQRVRAAIGAHLLALDKQGLLCLSDPEIAATQLVQLTAGAVAALSDQADSERVIAAGIDTFLAAYQAHKETTESPDQETPA